MNVRIDPYDYVTAADLLDTCSASAVRVASSAVGSLRPFASMAGDDPGGEGWARGYDASTAEVIGAVRSAAARLRALDRGVMQTGQLHQQTEKFSAGNAAAPAGFTVRAATVDAGSGMPPSAFGGDPNAVPDPAVWEWIKDFVGNVWPNADVGKLASASGAWTSIADDLTALATQIDRADQPLASAQSIEVAGITTMVSGLATEVRALATEARSLSDDCTEYAGDVESAHAEVWKMLAQLAVEIAATVGISMALAVFTAGISAGVGAAALAVRVAVVGGRVVAIISRVSATAGRITIRFFAVQSRVAGIAVRIVGNPLGRDIVSSTVAATGTEAAFNGLGTNVFAAGAGAMVGGGVVGGTVGIASRLGRHADGLVVQTVANATGGGIEGAVSSLITEGSFNPQAIVIGAVAGGAVGGGAAAFTRRGRGGAVAAGTPTGSGTTTSPGTVTAPAVPGAAPVGVAAGGPANVRTVDGPQVAGSTASSSGAGGAAPRADVDAPRVQGSEAMPPVAAAGPVVRPDVDAPRANGETSVPAASSSALGANAAAVDAHAADAPVVDAPSVTAAADAPTVDATTAEAPAVEASAGSAAATAGASPVDSAPAATGAVDADVPATPTESTQPGSDSVAGSAPVRDNVDSTPARSDMPVSDAETMPVAHDNEDAPGASDSANGSTSGATSADVAPDGMPSSGVEAPAATASTPSVGASAASASTTSSGTPANSVGDLDDRFDALQADLDERFDQLSDDINADFDKLEADLAASADRADAAESATAPDNAVDAGQPAVADAPARVGQADAPPSPVDYSRPTFVGEHSISGADVPGRDTPFATRTDLSPNTLYHVDGRGDFYTDKHGSVSYVETQYGGTGNLNADLMQPQPDTTYVVQPDVVSAADGASYAHVFVTDDQGRTVLAHTDHLALGDADRSPSVQSRVGNEGGAEYDGGHLFGNSYGGGGEYANMVAMLTSQNRGGGESFFNLENAWRKVLTADPDTKIMVDVRPHYSDGGTVPDVFLVKYKVGSSDWEEKDFWNE